MKKNQEVELLRGIAIICVLCSHFSLFESIANKIGCTNPGYIGVELFFVISGFGIALSFFNSSEFNLKQYFIKRIFRIYPSMIMLIIAASVLLLYENSSIHNELFSNSFADFLNGSFLLLTGRWNLASVPIYSYGAMWYLAVIIQFYIFCGVIYWVFSKIFFKRRNVAFIVSAVMIIVISLAARVYILCGGKKLMMLFSYILAWKVDLPFYGVIVAGIYNSKKEGVLRNIKVIISSYGLVVVPLLLAALCETPFSTYTDSKWLTGIGYPCITVLFSILVLIALYNENMFKFPLLIRKCLLCIGKYSYSIYISNFLALQISWYIIEKYFLWSMNNGIYYGMMQIVVGSILIGIISYLNYNLVEHPFALICKLKIYTMNKKEKMFDYIINRIMEKK